MIKIINLITLMFTTCLTVGNRADDACVNENQDTVSYVENDFYMPKEKVLSSLKDLKAWYQNRYHLESENQHTETKSKIDMLDNYIESKTKGSNHNKQGGTRSGGFGVSPYCTCDWLNYITDTPCENCQFYSATLDGAYTILAAFYVRGWSLAADLLSHNLSNTICDSDYYPSSDLTAVIPVSGQIDSLLANNELAGGYKQPDPGQGNGFFNGEEEVGDTYNALGKFYYGKDYHSNGYVTLNILDRYDWNRGNDCPGGIFVTTMYNAQELGIATPFYTCIELTTEGFGLYDWSYVSGGMIVQGYNGTNNSVVIPMEVLDLRVHSQNMVNTPTVTIGSNALKNKSTITSVTVPNTVTHIGNSAFENCTSLSSINIPNNLETLGNAVFKGCSSLQSISLPNTLIEAGSEAFKNCSSLTNVTAGRYLAPITSLGTNAFDGCSNSLQITVPKNRIGDYKNASGWTVYKNKIMPSNSNFSTYNINNNSNINLNDSLNVGCDSLYKLVVGDTNIYKIEATSGYPRTIKLYDSNMNILTSSNGVISRYLSNGGAYYLSVEFLSPDVSSTIYTNIVQDSSHYHNYTYNWYNYTKHTKSCGCGDSSLKAHVVSPNAFNNGQQYATCTLCGGLASAGINPLSGDNNLML